jgi:hypothetical protein
LKYKNYIKKIYKLKIYSAVIYISHLAHPGGTTGIETNLHGAISRYLAPPIEPQLRTRKAEIYHDLLHELRAPFEHTNLDAQVLRPSLRNDDASNRQTPELEQSGHGENLQFKKQIDGGILSGTVWPMLHIEDTHNILGAQRSGKQHLQQVEVGILGKRKANELERQQQFGNLVKEAKESGGIITRGCGKTHLPIEKRQKHKSLVVFGYRGID